MPIFAGIMPQAPKKRITFYQHPDQPRKDLLLMALDWTPEQILAYHEQCKVQHRALFGETEREQLTKGRKIVVRKLDNF